MEFVIRRKRESENLFAIKYYDCDMGQHYIYQDILFEDEEIAIEYGKKHFNFDETGYTNFIGVVKV